MHVLIDFDYTLFDTHALRQRLLRKWLMFKGVSVSGYHAAEQRAIKNNKGCYTLEGHVTELFQPADRARALSDARLALQDLTSCVYPDALVFLQQHQSVHISLLTFGNPQWQHQKIQASGVLQYIDDVITTIDHKGHALGDIAQESNIIMIDDKGQHLDEVAQVCVDAMLYWIQRPETPDATPPRSPHQRITTLTEIHV